MSALEDWNPQSRGGGGLQHNQHIIIDADFVSFGQAFNTELYSPNMEADSFSWLSKQLGRRLESSSNPTLATIQLSPPWLT